MDKEKLAQIQVELAKKVVLEDRFTEGKIAGVDLAYKGRGAVCAVVVLDFDSLEVVEEKVLKTEITFPYLATFLAFREAKPIIETLKDLDFDICMLDGQGIAHPRGLGIASHVGVLLDIPTIGVAKRLLCGEVMGRLEAGKPAPLIFEGRQVGYALVSKKGTRPIYISPGHRVSLESSLEITQHCIKKHKLPEPTRLAHILADSMK
jgi:deoxyribonuclease V